MFKAAAASYAGVLAQYLEGQRLLQASHCLPTPLVDFGRMTTARWQRPAHVFGD